VKFLKPNMNHSELILKTYREISSQLDQPYYVLGGVSGEISENQILYSSPSIKNIVGLSQFDLARDSKLFYDSIHPSFLKEYFEQNKQMQFSGGKIKRSYLLKNQQTGEFSKIEELATSRLNKERNCYEIYCSLIDVIENYEKSEDINKLTRSTYEPEELKGDEGFKKIIGSVSYLLEAFHANYKIHACRYYAFNDVTGKLLMLADIQNKSYQNQFETSTEVNLKTIIPVHTSANYFFEILLRKQPFITDKATEIVRILKAHTEKIILKQFARVAVRIYKLKSFGIIPITCPDGRIIGAVSFGSSKKYTEEEQKGMNEFIITNSLAFCCQLGKMMHHS
jgi:hypothetical protein